VRIWCAADFRLPCGGLPIGSPSQPAGLSNKHKWPLRAATRISDARLVAAFPHRTQEFFFEGHRQAFKFDKLDVIEHYWWKKRAPDSLGLTTVALPMCRPWVRNQSQGPKALHVHGHVHVHGFPKSAIRLH